MDDDGGNEFFGPIFDFFAAAARMGESWGEPWGLLFPAALALFLAIWVFGGLRYAAEKVQEDLVKWIGVTLAVIAVLIVAALNRERLQFDNDPAAVPNSESETTTE